MIIKTAAKVLAFSIVMLPITGCAIGVGLIFSAMIRGIAYAPDLEDNLFNRSMISFAIVETFALMLFFVLAIIFLQ